MSSILANPASLELVSTQVTGSGFLVTLQSESAAAVTSRHAIETAQKIAKEAGYGGERRVGMFDEGAQPVDSDGNVIGGDEATVIDLAKLANFTPVAWRISYEFGQHAVAR